MVSRDGNQTTKLIREIARVAISGVVLVVSLWVLFRSDDEAARKVACGFAGMVLGYWLK